MENVWRGRVWRGRVHVVSVCVGVWRGRVCVQDSLLLG